jgi:copper chaperone NosL
VLDRIRRALDGFYAFVDRPLFLWSRPALVVLLIPLALAFVRPLWAIEMDSPQHPGGLWLDVYATRVTSGHDGLDLVQINALHQTIGMRTIDGRTLGDLDWLPFGFGVLGLLVFRVAAVGNVRALIDTAVLVAYFVAFTLARFAHTVRSLGQQLNPDAPSRVAPFTPVMYGSQQIGDVTVRAGPGYGAFLVAIFAIGVIVIALWHLVEGKRKADREPVSP